MPPLRPLAGQGGHWRIDHRTTRIVSTGPSLAAVTFYGQRYTDDGRAGTGLAEKELKRLANVLASLQVPNMPASRAAAP